MHRISKNVYAIYEYEYQNAYIPRRLVLLGLVLRTFHRNCANQLSFAHLVEYGKNHGDFKIDGKYTFEVGGADKDYEQIADLPNSYILADDMEFPYGHKLPLWIIGFLY